jgi:hypothetical protein
LEPQNEHRVPWRGTVVFEWVPVGELAEDEYYRIDLDRPVQREGMIPAYGDWFHVKEPRFVWSGNASAPFHPPGTEGDAQVYWWVRVVRKTGQDEAGRLIGADISPLSEERFLILEPKQE